MTREFLPVEEWELDRPFVRGNGERITCGEAGCSIGIYLVDKASVPGRMSSQTFGPGCTKCEFSAALADVFNADERTFTIGAPESFKRGAALILTDLASRPVEDIRPYRPETARIIDTYAGNND